jgi:hemerythrin-like domain-containing protein
MISPALQQLYDEHETIMLAIDRLRSVLELQDLASQSEELRTLIAFFREYADGYHHQKEEEVLFPALLQINPAIEMLTESLAEHHGLFREAVSTAVAAIENEDWETTRATLDKYASDLVDHISAENDELFVAADDMLSESEKERIHYQFLDCDRALGVDRKHLFEEEVTGG